MESIAVRARGMVFDARAAGPADGELVLLLLHGFPQTSFVWRHQLGALAEAGYRAVAPDQRGYSPRARPAGIDAYRTEELVADVLAIADALGADRFHLVGHDWGGAVAWQVGGRHGERLRTLTSVSTPHPLAFRRSIVDGEQREKSSYMLVLRSPEAEGLLLADDAAVLRGIYEASGLDAEAVREYVRVLTGPGALSGALNWYRAADLGLLDGLGAIEVPTMYVWSTNDVALGREAAEATAACVEGPYRFEIFDGVSHWVPEERPAELSRLLVEHLGAA